MATLPNSNREKSFSSKFQIHNEIGSAVVVEPEDSLCGSRRPALRFGVYNEDGRPIANYRRGWTMKRCVCAMVVSLDTAEDPEEVSWTLRFLSDNNGWVHITLFIALTTRGWRLFAARDSHWSGNGPGYINVRGKWRQDPSLLNYNRVSYLRM